jgi:hypothetical protein
MLAALGMLYYFPCLSSCHLLKITRPKDVGYFIQSAADTVELIIEIPSPNSSSPQYVSTMLLHTLVVS